MPKLAELLSPKECAVAKLIGNGYTDGDIASELKTSNQVVKNILWRIYNKLGIKSRYELATIVFAEEMTDYDPAANSIQPKWLHEILAPHELKVTELVRAGMENKAIGAIIGKSEQTIKNYVRSILDKLGLETRLQLALRAHYEILRRKSAGMPLSIAVTADETPALS